MKFSKIIHPGEKLVTFLESSLNSLQEKWGSVGGQSEKLKLNDILKLIKIFLLCKTNGGHTTKGVKQEGDLAYFTLNSIVIPQVQNLIYLGLPIGESEFVSNFIEEKWKKVEKNLSISLNTARFILKYAIVGRATF
ncbi:hypothetical protein BpHYR1_031277 [Brachionus plicatilis]|uniref:RNA-directed DNA polymerase from mobile element jockey-like n=1 Tax=Brachionus plicatilis TaxID=10195 RepID=A0A3M7R864_BRAPC|nr:hypothetical protein BpHYR1_031277 [Brachionus plicatilis]